MNCKNNNCEKEFFPNSSWIKRAKYCSHKCYSNSLKGRLPKGYLALNKKRLKYGAWNKGTKGLIKANPGSIQKGNIPWNKDKKLGPSPKHAAFMKGRPAWNKGKRSPQISGKNNGSWRGGTTSLSKLICGLPEYKSWQQIILKRDNYTCRECGMYETAFDIDHIVPLSLVMAKNNIKTTADAIKCPELWDSLNGRLLCKPCHRETDTYGEKAKCIVKQYIQSCQQLKI